VVETFQGEEYDNRRHDESDKAFKGLAPDPYSAEVVPNQGRKSIANGQNDRHIPYHIRLVGKIGYHHSRVKAQVRHPQVLVPFIDEGRHPLPELYDGAAMRPFL
jgi:hypothetical protein